MRCPKCFGKIRLKSQKIKGDNHLYRCVKCHRKFELDKNTGRWREIA